MKSKKDAVILIQLRKKQGMSQDMEIKHILKAPMEALASKTKAFRDLLELATECLSNKDYTNARMVYASLFGDLDKEWLLEALNFNDLDCFSLQCCFAYSSVAANSKPDASFLILNSLHSPIKIPLVPYLKAFVHVSNESFSSAQKEMNYCRKLIDEGYNFKSNRILNEDIVPEINPEFLKLKLNGLKFASELMKAKEAEGLTMFKEHWMKIGKLCEYDFAKFESASDEAKLVKSPEKKKNCEAAAGAIKKSKTTNTGVQTGESKHVNALVQTIDKNIRAKADSDKIKTSSVAIQTVQSKHVNVHVQTNEKKLENAQSKTNKQKVKTANVSVQTKESKQVNVQVQTNGKDSSKEMLAILLDVKNKMNNLQSTKEDEVKKLARENHELKETISANKNQNKDFGSLKEQYVAMEMKYVESQKHVEILKKFLVEQIQEKHQMQKNIFYMFEEQCNNKMRFLNEVQNLIQPGFKISVDECVQEMLFWKNVQNKIIERKKKMALYYRNMQERISGDGCASSNQLDCPELPFIPIDSNDFVYRQFRNVLVHWGQICKNPISLPASYEKNKPKPPPGLNFDRAVGSCHKINEIGRNTNSPINNNSSRNSEMQFWNLNSNNVDYNQSMTHRNLINPSPGSQSPNIDSRNYTEASCNNFMPLVNSQNFPRSASATNLFLNSGCATNNFWNPGLNPQSSDVFDRDRSINFVADETLKEKSDASNVNIKNLFKYLKSRFEHIDENLLQQVTKRVLGANIDSLESISKETLVEIIRDSLKKDIKAGKGAWNEIPPLYSKWQNDHSENKCCICFDDYDSSNSCMLGCQHEFHKKCIQDWLKRQSACPVCRVYAVIGEEFPPLGKS